MNNKINLIYDITILGESSVNLTSRTGIFRVVENVLNVLNKKEEINIFLYPGKMNYWECLNYMKKNKHLAKCDFYKPNILFIHSFFGWLNAYISSIVGKRTTRIPVILFLRLLRKLLRALHLVFLKITDAWESDRKRELFSKYDLYHTSLYPVPSLIKKIETIKRFVTVFDVIPMLHPEFFADGSGHPLRRTITELNTNDHILSISEATKFDLCEYNKKIKPDHVYVTHLAASEGFRPCESLERIQQTKSKYNIPHDARYILSVATLEPRKNLSVLIKSFREILISQKMKDLYLVLSGTIGWKYAPMFEEIANSKEISKKIIFTGYVEDDDLGPLYSGAVVFVYPSLYEGFGLPPLEAMQCGVPVITSNTSSLPEVVGDAGIMVDPYDVESISKSILAVYHNDELRKEMARKSLERALHFSWDKTVEQTVQAYKKALHMCGQD